MITGTHTGKDVRRGYTPAFCKSVVASSIAIKQAMLSLATGEAVQGRDHVRVVLLFTAAFTVTGGKIGTGAEARNGVASLIVNVESGFASLKCIVN